MLPKPRVMIVEDDSDMIELLSMLMEMGGYEPIPAWGGKEALRLLKEMTVDLILLDLMMPEPDGWTVLRTIRDSDKLQAVPVIILTAKGPHEHPLQMQAHTDLFEGYLMKPFMMKDLLVHIEKAIH